MKIFGGHGEFEVNPITGEVTSELPEAYNYVLLVDPETLKPHIEAGEESIDILLVGYLYEKDGKIEYEPAELSYEQWLAEVGAPPNGAGVIAGGSGLMSKTPTKTVELTEDELKLLVEALDSHRYWQLSDPQYRNSGNVLEPGSDDEEKAAEIKACDALELKLGKALEPIRRISDDTQLLPHIVADAVISEVERFVGQDISDAREIADRLADKADVVYAAKMNKEWARRIRGAHGREHLYSFMRHWLSAELKHTHPAIFRKLPQTFWVGYPLPERP